MDRKGRVGLGRVEEGGRDEAGEDRKEEGDDVQADQHLQAESIT